MPPKRKKGKKRVATVEEIASLAVLRGGSRERKSKGELGGSALSWDPYGEKTLVRYATEQEHTEFLKRNLYSVVNYGGSTDKAIWFATKGGTYDAGFAAGRPWRVVVKVLVDEGTPLINFESCKFKGEASHPSQVILKENEKGAYGIGRSMIDKLKPKWEANPKSK
jgi:hypothetical protein